MGTKIFCDIADINQIKKFNKKKIVKGFTTNPSLIRKAGAKDYKSYCKKILKDVLHKIPNQITMGEDAAITYSYLSKCKKIAIVNSCNYFYRQRSNSIVKVIQDSNLEREHLQNLIYYLHKSLKDRIDKSKLKIDLLNYLYSQVLIRFGGGLSAQSPNIPFKGLKKNDKVEIVHFIGGG